MGFARKAGIAAAVAAVVALASVAAATVAVVRPPRVVSAETPADQALAFERVETVTEDGVVLRGWWVPAGGPDTVIFLHGIRDGKHQILPILPALHDAGFNVLALDFRAHGESGGAFTTVGVHETRDVAAAHAWVEARVGPAARVALYGWSMGGATAIRYAAHDPRIAAVVADASFARFEDVAGAGFASFTGLPPRPLGDAAVFLGALALRVDPATHVPARDVALVRGPVLLIQGTEDALMGDSIDALAEARPDAEVLRVAGAEHVAAHRTAPALYERTLVDFLARAFARG